MPCNPVPLIVVVMNVQSERNSSFLSLPSNQGLKKDPYVRKKQHFFLPLPCSQSRLELNQTSVSRSDQPEPPTALCLGNSKRFCCELVVRQGYERWEKTSLCVATRSLNWLLEWVSGSPYSPGIPSRRSRPVSANFVLLLWHLMAFHVEYDAEWRSIQMNIKHVKC